MSRMRVAAAILAGVVSTNSNTALSVDGYQDLAASENVRTIPYYDIAGVKTVCYGETQGVEDREYSLQECSEMLVDRVEHYFAPRIAACTKDWHRLPKQTRDALIELSWNIGVAGYCGSSVRKRLDAGYGSKACDRILLWNKARVRGQLRPIKGLTLRREREAKKCRDGFTAVA